MACVPRARSSRRLGDQEPAISILDLPFEIQCDIFTHSHRENAQNEPSPLPMEVVLSHVCSEWRNIAVNLPSLWTTLKFDADLGVSDPILNKLEEYLCRSGTLLLELYFSFSISGYKHDPNWNPKFARAPDLALVETAIAHSCRWRRFTLFLDAFIPSSAFTNYFDKIYIPNLEYLTLCLGGICPGMPHLDYGNIDEIVFTGGAPKLYAVRIDATIPFVLPPPLSNLTTLAIEGVNDDGVHVQFQDFDSILEIPTLTDLSIKACRSLDPSTYDDEKLEMPNLKTLRITEDSTILDTLSSIDAPLLETLVIHNVDLKNVSESVDQDTVTTFIRLDTIALLDCHYRFRYLDEEDINRVDTILNTLACHAMHIVISSHDGPSFIENGSNILDFSRYGWPRLQRITLDLPTSSCLASYIKIFERSPHLITVRVVEPLLDEWVRLPGGLTRLETVCKLETMKVGDPMMDEPWPAPGGLFGEDGNLENRFIWGETFHAKGPDWISEE